jgi:hypothetical protein
MTKYYPIYIVNRATWTLYTKHGKHGELYGDFLKRVHSEFDVDAACKDELELERLESSIGTKVD